MGTQWKTMILAIMAVFIKSTMAATYSAGGVTGGWDTSTDLQTWASTQSFSVGDNLVFQYAPMHDVLEVTKPEYDSCHASSPIMSDNSGTTTFPLSTPGKRYFICGSMGHCGIGMKLEINVLPVSSAPQEPSFSTPPPEFSDASPIVSSFAPPEATLFPTSPPLFAPAVTPIQSESPISVLSPPPLLSIPFAKSTSSSSQQDVSSARKCSSYEAKYAVGVLGLVMSFLAM